MKTIYFTAITELVFDQRMIRICSSLSGQEYNIVLVGRTYTGAPPLQQASYKQVRLFCWFTKGKMLYAEWNIKLFFFLLFKKMDLICAIDLDTILPCYIISRLKKIKRVYDAHELFTEMKEVIKRPFTKRIWLGIEKICVPRFKNGYTVSGSIAGEFKKRYDVIYDVIRNVPLCNKETHMSFKDTFILYQGAINEARGLEFLIPAMRSVNAELYIYGNGNFEIEADHLIKAYHLQDKVFIKPAVTPLRLKKITMEAYIGINLVENTGLNQYYSLANKFFDYINAGVPQLSMKYPEYENINNDHEVALLIKDLNESTIVEALNLLLSNQELYKRLQQNCYKAREVYNWEQEEKRLVIFYNNLFRQP